MRKMLLLVATKRYVSVNKIYIVSLSIKGEVQTASKKEWNFYLKLSALIKEKMKKLYRSQFYQVYGYKTNSFVSVLNELKLWRHQVNFKHYLWGNPEVLPFKWNLLARTSTFYHLFRRIFETVRIISLVTMLFRRVKASEVGEKSKTRAEIQNTVIV